MPRFSTASGMTVVALGAIIGLAMLYQWVAGAFLLGTLAPATLRTRAWISRRRHDALPTSWNLVVERFLIEGIKATVVLVIILVPAYGFVLFGTARP